MLLSCQLVFTIKDHRHGQRVDGGISGTNTLLSIHSDNQSEDHKLFKLRHQGSVKATTCIPCKQ